jgi:hypothetical protein
MASFFILALVAVLIWLFAESKTTRVVGLSIVGGIAVLVAAYLVWRETERSTQGYTPQVTMPAQPAPQAESFERSLTALKPSDVQLSQLKFESGKEIYFGIDGKQYERPDLKSWTLSGEVKNLSTEYGVKDVSLNVRLFSCPSYYTLSHSESKIEELALVCSKVGERSLGLYDLELAQQEAKRFSQSFSFANQGKALNWRFWVDVTRVVARL